MTAAKSLFIAFIISLLGLQQAWADQQKQIDTILDQTGFNKLLDHIPNFAQAVLKQSSGALEPEVNSALSAAFNQAFASESVKRDVVKVVKAHYNGKAADGFIQQLQSPLVRKMSELERQVSAPDQQQALQSFAAELNNTPAPAQRSAMIQRLDKANRSTDFSVDMQTAFFKAIFVAIDPVMESDMRISSDEMDKMVGEVRKSLQENIETSTKISYLYAFRDVADDELNKYIKTCESDDYRWGIQLLGNAMISALNEAADRAAQLMTTQAVGR